MIPITPVLPSSPSVNEIVFAKYQRKYSPLPAVVGIATSRPTTSRWRLTWRERLDVLLGGSIWLTLLTFGKPLQPILIRTKEPPNP